MQAAHLLFGQVMHQRLRPVSNRFVYRAFCVRLDLDRLDEAGNRWFGVDCWRPLAVHTSDYGPRDGSDLAGWMRSVLRAAGIAADGRIALQTFPRVLGYVFNPVSFWYCHDRAGALLAVLAEVNNTFGETHRYLLAAADGSPITAETVLHSRKVLHVSPFFSVEGVYRFRFRDMATTCFVGIDYHDSAGLVLKTAIGGRLVPLTASHAVQALLGYPLFTAAVIARIHWQALKLWFKRVPIHRKPLPPAAGLSQPEETGS
ncbi:DUF1365 domain-containing protein [Chitiniphilus purpureus]|uniref:DUF1365 domain-containing protein n=1 Tax=Chitiniphilus purpureus TaxID=2981137 RepID=A0ABY6DVF7_9NEIS|nr:DUF1365 domain-containing protein [Chitiniphilus sp. CD1]UXY15838.1 DUF1365 domain-containing protein [Chitiniphilus sp. CD1]